MCKMIILVVFIFFMGCGAVVSDGDNQNLVDGYLCAKSGHVCQNGMVCKNKGDQYFCGCEDERMASCSGATVCGTNIKEDIDNCGSCGHKCRGEGSKCEDGKCVCYEEGKAVDLDSGMYIDGSGRGKSCGECGYVCSKGIEGSEIVCVSGVCGDHSCDLVNDRSRHKSRCGEDCYDLKIEVEHCGKCETNCKELKEGNGDRCLDGKCVCGEVGVGCGVNEVCVNGKCKCGEGEGCGGGSICRNGKCVS